MNELNDFIRRTGFEINDSDLPQESPEAPHEILEQEFWDLEFNPSRNDEILSRL